MTAAFTTGRWRTRARCIVASALRHDAASLITIGLRRIKSRTRMGLLSEGTGVASINLWMSRVKSVVEKGLPRNALAPADMAALRAEAAPMPVITMTGAGTGRARAA